MCISCASLSTYTPECEFTGQANEGVSDWGMTAATAGSMTIGSTVSGSIGTLGDVDWVAVTIAAGQSIDVVMTGTGGGLSWGSNCLVNIVDASGAVIAGENNFGTNFSETSYTNTTGTQQVVYIAVEDFGGDDTGTYTLSVQDVAPPPPPAVATMDEIADFLVNGFWEGIGSSARMWNVGTDNAITYDMSTLSPEYQAFAVAAFQTWTDLIGVNFVSVTSGAEITFQETDLGSAYSSSTTSGGFITSNLINIGSDWDDITGDDYTFQTFIHEIGHTLGLGHAGAYNGNAIYGVDETFANDSWQASIMSYFSQSENTTVNASFAYLLTPMLADLIAIQSIYGASTTTRTGDTVYGYNSNAGPAFDLTGLPAGSNFNYAMTIFDSGGIDTIDLSGTSQVVIINLMAEAVSSVLGETGNLVIGRGVVIENAIGGSGNDTITGNSANNTLIGGAGADILDGGSNGAFGDTASYAGSSAGVRVSLAGGTGLYGDAQGDTLTGIENLIGSSHSDTLIGGNGVNRLDGGDGNDFLFDFATGDDIMNGGGGNDTMQGGTGADQYDGGTGTDTVRYNNSNAAVIVNLKTNSASGGHAQGDTFVSVENLVGSQYADTLTGDDNTNRLEGFSGDDILMGGLGADVLYGDLGFDTADYSDSATGIDVGIYRTGTGGTAEGDTLIYIERIIGSDHDDTLIGGGPASQLDGGDGNDLLFDYSGAATLNGGDGDDLLMGGANGDTMDGGTGIDTARYANSGAGVTVNLVTNVNSGGDAAGDTLTNIENVVGSQYGDTITGDANNNRIEGLNGDDILKGGLGNDALFGGAGADRFVYDTTVWGNDTIFDFTDGVDRIDLTGSGLTFSDFTVVDTAFGIRLDYNDNGTISTIAIANLDPADISAADFIF